MATGKTSRLATLAIKHPLRVEILNALSDGAEIGPVAYATEHALPVGNVRYHFGALRDADAITLVDERARITEQGQGLRKLAARPERRSRERRSRPTRRSGP